MFEADPASSEALEWASRAYALAGDPKNAQRIGEAGLARFPDKAEFARIVFHGRMKDGHFEEALQVARKSASDNPEDHAPRVAEGHALLKLDRRDEAIDAFEDAIRRAPDCGAGYAGMLEALGPGAAPDRIRGVFRDALASGDFSGVDFAEVSRWATHNGYETEALAILDKISESNPDAVSVYAGERGAVLEKLGKSAEAEEQHALAAEAMQKHLDIILAQFSAQTENADLAQLECERNMRAKILEHLISVFEAGKKPLQAQRCLEALQKLSPNRSATSRAEMASETPVVQP